MNTQIIQERMAKLIASMRDRHIDVLCIGANAWRSDYLRYAIDVTLLEGEAMAFIEGDGTIALLVQSATEARRLQKEYPQFNTVHAHPYYPLVKERLNGLGSKAVSAAPLVAMPQALLHHTWAQPIEATVQWIDLLMLHKSGAEADAVEHAGRERCQARGRVARPWVGAQRLDHHGSELIERSVCPEFTRMASRPRCRHHR